MTRQGWEGYWTRQHEVESVYSNSGRLGREIERRIDLSGALALEVGGGTGRDGEDLAQRGARVVELDFAWSALRIIKERSKRADLAISVIAGDAFHLPFPNASFDVVFHQGLLEHFPPARSIEILKENARVLRPGGVLCADVPQRWHPYTLMKHTLMAAGRWLDGWERSFSIGELRRNVRAAGFVVTHEYGEWLQPSLGYRVIREVAKGVGAGLPLHPRLSSRAEGLRATIRRRSRTSGLLLWTGQSIGIVARKP
jgi:SAM-dependent methyltransferase